MKVQEEKGFEIILFIHVWLIPGTEVGVKEIVVVGNREFLLALLFIEGNGQALSFVLGMFFDQVHFFCICQIFLLAIVELFFAVAQFLVEVICLASGFF